MSIRVRASHVYFPCSCSKVNTDACWSQASWQISAGVSFALVLAVRRRKLTSASPPTVLSPLWPQEDRQVGPKISPGQINCKDYGDFVKKDYTLFLCYPMHQYHDLITCHTALCVGNCWSCDGLEFGVTTFKGLVCSEKCTFPSWYSALYLRWNCKTLVARWCRDLRTSQRPVPRFESLC